MNFKRPSPEVIAARKYEIARRYARKAKVGLRSRGMAAIRLSELMRWLDDTFGAGVELEPSPQSERLVRIFTHHFLSLPDGPRRVTAWFDRYCPWLSLRDREYLISEASHCPLKWSADKLAWRLKITDEQRTRLRIKTIGAIDCNREQREQRRKAQQAQLQRTLRAKRKAERVNSI